MRKPRIIYTADEMAWLKSNRDMVITDYHAAFVAAFDRQDVSAANLHGLRKRKGWKVGRAPGRFTGRNRSYSPEEIAWLGENRTLSLPDCHSAFVAKFARKDFTPQKLHSLRKRLGLKTGRTGHFEKGRTPENKGKRCPEGVSGRHPNARKTQFKAGQTPANLKPLGTERVRSDGYVEISVAERNPYTGAAHRYVQKHIHLWEAANGPIPEGHCLKCLDGDKTNTDPANWKLISRGVLPRLNGGRATRVIAYDTAPAELKPTILAVAQIEHRAREIRRSVKN